MRKATLTRLLSVSVTEDMSKLLKGLADTDNVSVGELIRTALDYALGHDYAWRKPKLKNPKEEMCFRFKDLDDIKFGE
ncbi:MAG: ribbon-helix-helix protein, CopG family [Syntrophales bacterium]